ncbi:Dyp-type peroxidase [Vibrio sp. WJH972]
MMLCQSAILPEAEPFALYTLFKIKSEPNLVLEHLKKLPKIVDELNQAQPGAKLTLSIAFTSQFWAQCDVAMPTELVEFQPLGEGDIYAPATDVDFIIHAHSARHDLLFYFLRKFVCEVESHIEFVDESYGFRYLDARDTNGFIDGTENPENEERKDVAIIPDGEFSGGSYVMLQRFVHNLPAWERLNISAQEKVIGRTKPDSIELDNVPANSHVGRVDIKKEGVALKIVRHSLPYGSVSGDHGLVFIAYCNTLSNFQDMLHSMYGMTDGKTDSMLRFTKAVTGVFAFAPSQEMLQALTLK